MNKVVIAIGLILAIVVPVGILALFGEQQVEVRTFESNPTLSAEGIFDRIELVDRHYGDFNGMEVEGNTLAVLNQSGVVSISAGHYEGSFSRYKQFPFYLYIYHEVDHLRERISVMGGDTEEYVYLNVTVTVSLKRSENVTLVDNNTGNMIALSAFVLIIGALVLYEIW